MDNTKAIFLFADSQLLFWRHDAEPFLNTALSEIDDPQPGAAYVGASNGDLPEFYDIFLAAMAGIGIDRCRMIRSEFSREDREFLERASLILLAGGEVERGWAVFRTTGLGEAIVNRYLAGAVLIGISAGAVQLGSCSPRGEGERPLDTFQLIPAVIDVHEEQSNWAGLKRALCAKRGFGRGIGIPSGGGMIYHADHTVEAVRRPLEELTLDGDEIRSNLIMCRRSAG